MCSVSSHESWLNVRLRCHHCRSAWCWWHVVVWVVSDVVILVEIVIVFYNGRVKKCVLSRQFPQWTPWRSVVKRDCSQTVLLLYNEFFLVGFVSISRWFLCQGSDGGWQWSNDVVGGDRGGNVSWVISPIEPPGRRHFECLCYYAVCQFHLIGELWCFLMMSHVKKQCGVDRGQRLCYKGLCRCGQEFDPVLCW
jgi:hypothetical protein